MLVITTCLLSSAFYEQVCNNYTGVNKSKVFSFLTSLIQLQPEGDNSECEESICGPCDQQCLVLQQQRCVEIFPNFLLLTFELVSLFPTEGGLFLFVFLNWKRGGESHGCGGVVCGHNLTMLLVN